MGILAWRNLWRNRGRTLIVVSAIALSLGLMLVSYGMTLDRNVKMMQAAVRSAGGNVLVHADGYWDARTSDLQMPDGDAIADRVASIPGVSGVIRRVIISGLLTSTHGGEGAQIMGVDLEGEAQVYDFRPRLVTGQFFTADDQTPLVLGDGLAELLDVEVGDRVVLTATGPDGEVARALFHVTGTLHTGVSMIDDSLGLTNVAAARAALSMDTHLTQVGVLLTDDDRRVEVDRAIAAALADLSAPVEVLTWDEAIPDLLGFVEIDEKFAMVYTVVIGLVVAFGIANTLLMMVMERIRELGMLNAIGMGPRRVAILVLLETMLLALVAVTVGFALGFAGHLALVHWGLDLSKLSGGELDIAGVSMNDTIIRSQFDALRWGAATGVVVLVILASSLYPAWRAMRLDPVEAMRTYE